MGSLTKLGVGWWLAILSDFPVSFLQSAQADRHLCFLCQFWYTNPVHQAWVTSALTYWAVSPTFTPRFLTNISMYMDILPACGSMCMPGVLGGQKGETDSLQLELQMVTIHHVGTRNQIQVPQESSHCPYLLSHLSIPLNTTSSLQSLTLRSGGAIQAGRLQLPFFLWLLKLDRSMQMRCGEKLSRQGSPTV